MKLSTGIVRRIDNLGRVVLPKEMRRELDIKENDQVEISIEGGSIVIKKHQNKCVFCGSITVYNTFKEKRVCKKCWETIQKS